MRAISEDVWRSILPSWHLGDFRSAVKFEGYQFSASKYYTTVKAFSFLGAFSHTLRIMQLKMYRYFHVYSALSALNNAYLGNVMGTNVVTHRDSNSSLFLHERARVSSVVNPKKTYPIQFILSLTKFPNMNIRICRHDGAFTMTARV